MILLTINLLLLLLSTTTTTPTATISPIISNQNNELTNLTLSLRKTLNFMDNYHDQINLDGLLGVTFAQGLHLSFN